MRLQPRLQRWIQFLAAVMLLGLCYLAFKAYVGPNSLLDLSGQLFLC
jgi:hypothetical protein